MSFFNCYCSGAIHNSYLNIDAYLYYMQTWQKRLEWGIRLLLQYILLLDPFMNFFSLLQKFVFSFVLFPTKYHTVTVERIICPKMLSISKWNPCTNSIFIISMKITEKENADMKNLAVSSMYPDIVIIRI